MTPTQHPQPQTLAQYWAGELNPGAALTVSAHLESCPTCRGAQDPRAQTGRANASTGSHEAPITRALARQPGARLGRWRWAGPGLRLAHVQGAAGLGERVYALEGRPDARLAPHGHSGAERIAVLQGQFREGDATFQTGDFSEHAEAACTHRLRVIGDEVCLCLVATEGPLQLSGPARLLQAWLGV